MIEPGIYVGTLRHRRFSPKRHDFTYPLFMPLLDIDKLDEQLAVSWMTGHNKPRWASFWDEDHFGDLSQSLRARLAADAKKHGHELPPGKIFLLTHLRYLGYNFNPVSFFYCYDEAGELRTIVAEVNNTFGETQNYWLPSTRDSRAHNFTFEKSFHVSPFIGMDCTYHWTFTDPGDSLIVQTANLENGATLFDATLKLERREWSAQEVRRTLLRFPMVTVKTIAAIHWHAILLWLKRVPVAHHPGAGRFTRVNKPHFGAAWSAGGNDVQQAKEAGAR